MASGGEVTEDEVGQAVEEAGCRIGGATAAGYTVDREAGCREQGSKVQGTGRQDKDIKGQDSYGREENFN